MNDLKLAQMYINKARSAEQRGITFTLSFSRYKQLRKTKRCFFSGVLLTCDNFSLDRLDNSEGYTDSNTVACDEVLNKRKGVLSVEDIKCLYKGLRRRGLVK